MFGIRKIKEAQERAMEIKASLSAMQFNGESMNGMVTVKCNGDKTLTSVDINESAFKVRPKEDIEDMILQAVNEAMSAADIESQKKMREALPNIPGL